MSYADPMGPRGPRRGGGVTMSAKAISDIRDDEVRALKQKEMGLRAELATLRGEVRTAMTEKDQAMRKLQQPAAPAGRGQLGGDFDKLLAEKDEWNRKMDALRLEQAGISRVRDELRTLDYEGDAIIRDLRAAEQRVRDAKVAADHAAATRDAMLSSMQFKTISDADEELAKIEARIAAATKRSDMALVRELGKAKDRAEKAKKLVQQSYTADEDVFKRTEQLKKAEDAVAAAAERKRAVDGKKADLKERLAKRPNFNEEFDRVRSKLDAIRKKMDDVKGKMRKESKAAEQEKQENSGVAEARAALDALRARQDAITSELDSIAKKIPSVEIAFSPDLRQEILGRGGATLDQLRADFGVAIDFTPEKTNCLTIIGAQEDCDATKAALEQMLENLALSRKTASVTFDPSIAPSLIGSRGSNIERIQNISGAKIKVTSSEGTAHIVGTQEAVDAAKAMIEQHVANSASMAMKFERDLRDIVFGKGGATVRKIEEESGAKKVRVDRDACIISAFGTQEAVDKVKAFYTELLADLSGGGFQMTVDKRMAAVIIGPGGSTISDIQNTTGAIINVNDGRVTIRGSKEAQQAARAKIEDLTRRDEIKIPFPRALFGYLVTRPLVAPEGAEEGERVQQEERNSPLEEIKFQCACDQVSAIRAENCVVLRGRKENVADAKRMLQDLLLKMRPETEVVRFPDVLSTNLTRRSGADKMTALDRVKVENPGIYAVDMDRRAGTITISGEKPAVEAGAKAFTEIIDGLKKKIGEVPVPATSIGLIIGNGGSTISELQRRHAADINVSREKQMATIFCRDGEDAVKAVIADIEALVKGEALPSKQPKEAKAAAESNGDEPAAKKDAAPAVPNLTGGDAPTLQEAAAAKNKKKNKA